MIGENWEIEQPWAWSLDTMIAGHVPDVEIDGDGTGGMNPPAPVGERIVVGPTWWDNHSVEQRREALMDAIGGSDYL